MALICLPSSGSGKPAQLHTGAGAKVADFHVLRAWVSL